MFSHILSTSEKYNFVMAKNLLGPIWNTKNSSCVTYEIEVVLVKFLCNSNVPKKPRIPTFFL
jgi:hypothetical protein